MSAPPIVIVTITHTSIPKANDPGIIAKMHINAYVHDGSLTSNPNRRRYR